MTKSNYFNVEALPHVPEPESFYQVGTQLYYVGCDLVPVLFGNNVLAIGQVALVAGTKAVAVPGTKATSKAFIQLVTPANAANTVERQAVCTVDTLTITALLAAHTINAADTSTVNYIIYQ